MAGEAFPEAERLSLETFDGLLAGLPDDARWELIGGRFVPATMGEPWEHALIVGNIARSLSNIFRATGSPFWTFTETFYLKSAPLASAMLPDVIVGSGRLEPGATWLENPTVLFEVLSPETEARDRTDKWRVYRQLTSLKHYVLVARDRPLADVFDRTGEEWISRRPVDGLDAALELSALGASLPLAAIYHRVIKP